MYTEQIRKYFKFCGFVVVALGAITVIIGMTATMVNYEGYLPYAIYIGIPLIIIGVVISVITSQLKPGYVTRKQKKIENEKSKKK